MHRRQPGLLVRPAPCAQVPARLLLPAQTGECKTAIETWLEEQAVFSPQDPTNFSERYAPSVDR